MEEFIKGLLEEPLTLVDVVQHGLFECTVAIRIEDTDRDWSYNLEDIYNLFLELEAKFDIVNLISISEDHIVTIYVYDEYFLGE